MRQLKNCKKGHFVKYKGVLYQINCFFTGLHGKQATLIEVKNKGPKCVLTPSVTEKVEYFRDRVKDEHGTIWITMHKPEIF